MVTVSGIAELRNHERSGLLGECDRDGARGAVRKVTGESDGRANLWLGGKLQIPRGLASPVMTKN